jgi:Ca-activated chloride channel family protein
LSPRHRLFCAWAVGLWLLPAAAAWAVVKVQIVSPAGDQPVFGQVVFEVKVAANEAIDRVEFLVNGRAVGVVHKPPFRITTDVGEENVGREFLAIVHGASGASASSRVQTAAVRIDEQMELRLQQLFVTVTRDGKRDLRLGQEAFHVYDNGVEQKLVTFGRGELPLSAALIIDASESMRGSLLAAAVAGANAFIAGMKPLDETMLALFSDHLLRATPFTDDRRVLQAALANADARGGTAVNDFLYMSLKLLDTRKGRRVVVLLSDGSDVSSVLPMEEVLRKSRRSQAQIYWIQLEGGEKHRSYSSAWHGHLENDKQYRDLERAVEDSGGRIQPIERIDQIEPAFRSILQELRDQYALGYYPSNLRANGGWHEVRVRIDESGDRARTAAGYVDY